MSAQPAVDAAERATIGREHYERAKEHASQDDIDGAILAYETAIALAPDFAEAHSNLGNLYAQRGRCEDALRAYKAAIHANPELAAIHCNFATLLIGLGRYGEAIAALETASRLAPDLYEAHANLSQVYRRSGRDREALLPALRATQLRPNRDAFVYLGAAASKLDALDVALEATQEALALDAASAEAHTNLGWIYHLTGRYAEAITAGEAAIALRPDLALAHVNLAPSLLICGDFTRGWDEYVWAWRPAHQDAPLPRLERVTFWNGEVFSGRDLLITCDRGFADVIQMVRYLPMVKARGGRIILEVAAPLIALFADLPGVDELHFRSGAAVLADDVDLQIPILALPRVLGTDLDSIPSPIPYLCAAPERVEHWRPRLERSASLRVGIVWAAGSGHRTEHAGSVRLEDVAMLGDIEGIAWFGLQDGDEGARRSCGSLMLDPLGAEIGDFADTAAIIAQLDLVIAVDTAIVHVAGALGIPVWTLLPSAPDWRWLLARSDSPWYPTMRLFRQPSPGDWMSVFKEVARALSLLASARRRSQRIPIRPTFGVVSNVNNGATSLRDFDLESE